MTFSWRQRETAILTLCQQLLTLDSNEPLPVYVSKTRNSNAPGTDSFKCSRKEEVPRKHSFCGNPGLKVALDIFKEFVAEELLVYILEETNRYAELMHVT